MILYLSKTGNQVPGDLVLDTIQRSDLAPVPRTLEFTVQLRGDLESKLSAGASVWAGREHLEYSIVKRERSAPTGVIQGETPVQAIKYTAFLASCKSLAEPTARAVIGHNESLASLYLACGARVAIGNDFNVTRFASLVGDVPSVAIALALQEEGAALVMREGKLSIERLNVLMAQKPVHTIGQGDSSAALNSELLERHEIAMGFSIAPDGSIVKGNYGTSRRTRFIPRQDARTLQNLSKVLVTRRVIDSSPAPHVRAGDIITIGGVSQLVITAAHRDRQRNGGMQDNVSRFWVGDLSV
ncbi:MULTISPECIES: hypothetical protein [Pseudomonas]|uniref:Uncharacterized protein n=1 Tax=Pseudomonas lutea TaxID=243924 RepID=A0A9X8MH18_9PSED|nr:MULTISPECIES: hypothetical protein [Pseudomonas]SER35742.1 hypothetical protein SAMN05216409_11823 [Pseudomonas lutea]